MWDELRARPHLALSAAVFVVGVLLWEALRPAGLISCQLLKPP